MTVCPCAFQSSATFCNTSVLRLAIYTLAPFAANELAIISPIPVPPPVTSATFPLRVKSLSKVRVDAEVAADMVTVLVVLVRVEVAGQDEGEAAEVGEREMANDKKPRAMDYIPRTVKVRVAVVDDMFFPDGSAPYGTETPPPAAMTYRFRSRRSGFPVPLSLPLLAKRPLDRLPRILPEMVTSNSFELVFTHILMVGLRSESLRLSTSPAAHCSI